MDDIIGQFLTLGTVVLVVSVVVVTFVIRRAAELLWPILKQQATAMEPKALYAGKVGEWWNEFILPLIPVLLGGSIVLLDRVFFVNSQVHTIGGAVFYGSAVGWFSERIYCGVKKTIVKKAGADDADPVTGS
jgi:hypothetical protein